MAMAQTVRDVRRDLRAELERRSLKVLTSAAITPSPEMVTFYPLDYAMSHKYLIAYH
jgi:hypothetical protein